MPREYVDVQNLTLEERKERYLEQSLKEIDRLLTEKDSKTLDSIYETLKLDRDRYLSISTESHKQFWQIVIDYFLEKRAELKK